MQKMKLKDEVIVLAGKDKGKTGTVEKIFDSNKKILVKGVNLVKKAVRPSQENPAGGFLEVERPVHASNLALISPKTNKATRVRIEVRDGKKVRVAVKCGSVLK
ncbi:MAG: 50S ribosomal protein L24 [Bdellovibrionales bacterium CG12_big_fil_rev_8_21_14_0_65_38_15]|nr:MAG: 50S ribosomal protein L24 [Bdellovibrionales bacterium CG22_combo_CG10-13_8_21_14_all_38_13]PIQ55434.1 MAG: 50S ribosomal protein L24 [Bdellovibrionales bacterium CG12_big_fil_rev_8_21_14_0_65_38_15]PIR29175.1 MAG: 50S ribosomal protein L24 [Bdellovibrionales bacterium CG11_big_fil_rev_8_21_14_0_20_38_13]